MNSGLLAQTIISGFVISAALIVFLRRFAGRRARWPQVAAALVFLDLGSKWIVFDLVRGSTHSYLWGQIQISYYTNYLQGFGATSPWVLPATLVCAVSAVRLYLLLADRRYVMSTATECGLALMLGGIAVIAAERACCGFVVDFLQIGAHSDYVCNFADLGVFAGTFVLLLRAAAVLPSLVEQGLSQARGGAE